MQDDFVLLLLKVDRAPHITENDDDDGDDGDDDGDDVEGWFPRVIR